MGSAEEFALLLKSAPSLFGRLLCRQKRIDSIDLREKVLAFFQHLAKHKKFSQSRIDSLPTKRVLRFAGRAGLEFSDARLPLELYEDFTSGSYHSDNGYSEEELRFCFTGAGCLPIEWWFLVAEEFRLWNPHDGEFHYSYTLDGDPLEQKAKADYLRSIGSAFGSMQEALMEAGKRGLLLFSKVDEAPN